MATPVHELDLPLLPLSMLESEQFLEAYETASKDHWLAKTPFGYAVMHHADVTAILRDRRFHSALSMIPEMRGVDLGDMGSLIQRQQKSILGMEGDEHARLRRIVASAFTPKAADRLRPFMREVVDGLVDQFADKGRCELVTDVCEPYPIPIICQLLGAPKDDWKLFSGWATDIFKVFSAEMFTALPRIRAAFDELDDYVRAMVERRRSQPADDLLSDLIAAEEAGDKLAEDELVMLAEAVLMAGTDTTRNQLACSVALLSDHPEQWRALGENPALAAGAVEETMRHLGAVRGTARVASVEIEYRDVLFPSGALVNTSLATANVDPAVFADPHAFDITRSSSSPHMTFGSGIHYCLGASLARAELQEALPLLARRMPDLKVDGVVEWKPPTVGIWGPSRLPLTFTPSP